MFSRTLKPHSLKTKCLPLRLYSQTKQVKNSNLNVSNLNNSNLNNLDPNKKVGLWLLGCSGLVFGIVCIGGLTRLTKSGLSMTDWKFSGGLPPLTKKEWIKEFNKYRSFPEYSMRGSIMTLKEFKRIYRWEYIHRMFGRLIGFAFFIPFCYFGYKGYINKSLYKNLSIIFGLGFTQGLIGWWMVKSGLDKNEINKKYNTTLAKVSPYRLSIHLTTAISIYILLLYNGFNIYSKRNNVINCLNLIKNKISPDLLNGNVNKLFKYNLYFTFTSILLTTIMGSFVAGNEAGLIYNEWPKMGLGYIPSDLINPYIKPLWKNIFEHPTCIQFLHRNLAYITILSSSLLVMSSFINPILSQQIRFTVRLLQIALILQATLGIYTLREHVPISLASSHQIGSLSTITIGTLLLFLSRKGGYGGSNILHRQLTLLNKPRYLIV